MKAPRAAWLLLLILTIAVRLGFALWAPRLGLFRGADGSVTVAQGSDGYEKIARNLLAGNGYRIRADNAPTMLRSPGYVLLLTTVFAVVGSERVVGHVVQALTAGGVLLLIGQVGKPLVGQRPALLAGAMYALYPADWIACAKYVAEPLLGLLMLLAILAVRRFRQHASTWSALSLGLVAGALGLTKSVCVFLLPMLLPVVIVLTPALRPAKRALFLSLVALTANGLVLFPWALHNYRESGRWIITSTVVGWALFESQFVQQHRDPARDPADTWIDARAAARQLALAEGITPDPRDEWAFSFFDIHDELAMGDLLKRHAIELIASDPWQYVLGSLRRAAEFWYLGRSRTSTAFGLVLNVPLLILAAIGVVRGRLLRNPEFVCILAVVAYMNLMTAASFAVARYAMVLMPLLVLPAARGLVAPEKALTDDTEAMPA